MKVLVVGSGGREHAIVSALARSSRVTKIYSDSQNAGILQAAQHVDAAGMEALAQFALSEGIDLTIVGPEQPLVDGFADCFRAHGLKVFGPGAAAARLEGSKIFSKEFAVRHSIPTAHAEAHTELREALNAIRSGRFTFPVVIKADGLAAGKGVIIAENRNSAIEAVTGFMSSGLLGGAGRKLLIEEFMTGRELSYLIITDGTAFISLPFAQDHKRAYDGDLGPNTGGMGVFSCPGMLDAETEAAIVRTVVRPTLRGASAEGFPITGVLFIGLMLTPAGPKVLEYNVRFGDPETQTVLRRLDSDIVDIFEAAVNGTLESVEPVWSNDAVTTVIMASAGYPGSYETGKTITGISEAETIEGVKVFHSGTRNTPDRGLVSAGGRVLAVTARAAGLEESRLKAYQAVEQITFEGAFYRKDIGRRGIEEAV